MVRVERSVRSVVLVADDGGPVAGLEQLLDHLSKTDTNADLLKGIAHS